MKLKVNQDSCIGCGACIAVAEDLFKMDENGLSTVKEKVIPEDKVKLAKEALETCPTGAIVEDKEENK